MHHVMFDVDGTLVESFRFDEVCYCDAVYKALGHEIDDDWLKYRHVTDSGILDQHLLAKGLMKQREVLHSNVKDHFIANIRAQLLRAPVKEVRGAIAFVEKLKSMPDVSLSIATGGWGETAKLKLSSAGFDVEGIPMASSNDHYSRTEIMKLALKKASVTEQQKVTYFGDAIWDKKACEALNFNFVLVGNRTTHSQNVIDLTLSDEASCYIGL